MIDHCVGLYQPGIALARFGAGLLDRPINAGLLLTFDDHHHAFGVRRPGQMLLDTLPCECLSQVL